MTPADEAAFEAFKIAQHMSRDLDTVDSLSDIVQVRIALRHAGHCDDAIDNYMHDAIEVAQERRSPGRYIRGMMEATTITFCLGVMYFVLAPDRAYAADTAGLIDSIPDLTVIGALCIFGLGYFLGSRGKTRVHVVEPYADPADFGRH